MASNKNQHFVPRCYLRPFTVDEAGVAINLYNIDRRRFIRMAPVKNQCSGNYFYGRNRFLEEDIQNLEIEYSTALRLIISPGYMLTNQHKRLLGKFWLFQHLRTEEASRRAIVMNEGMWQATGISGTTFRMEIREAVQMSMEIFVKTMDIVSDLQMCLIRNRTQIPFITSDDPAVLTNRWYLQNPRGIGRSFGFMSAGAIILLPISPSILCLGYDRDVYNVPHRNLWCDVRDPSEVKALNQHQFLNCRANIFVQNPDDSDMVHECFLDTLPFRISQRYRYNYAVRDRSEGDYERFISVDPTEVKNHGEAIVHLQTLHPSPAAWPRLLSWKKKGFIFYNGTGVGYVRRKHIIVDSSPPFRKERARGN